MHCLGGGGRITLPPKSAEGLANIFIFRFMAHGPVFDGGHLNTEQKQDIAALIEGWTLAIIES